MTTEYRPGEEDRGIVVIPKQNGMVTVGICTLEDQRVLEAIAVSPEIARVVAQNLTLASWTAEEWASNG